MPSNGKFDLMIRNATVATASDLFRCDIAVKDGRIAALGDDLGRAEAVIDAAGKLVTPGLIDLHTHLCPHLGLGLPADELVPITCTTTAVSAGESCARWRKMFSIMMTVASTMMPRSIAPIDSRLADSPRITVIITARNSATGIFAATISAQRRSPRNTHWIRKISATPNSKLCSTVCTVIATRSPRS